MPYSPPKLRGWFYPSPGMARCPNYQRCPRCLQCDQYNRHCADCVTCERFKQGVSPCGCTDHQKLAIVQMEQKLDRPLFDPNAEPSKVHFEPLQTSFERENTLLVEELARTNGG